MTLGSVAVFTQTCLLPMPNPLVVNNVFDYTNGHEVHCLFCGREFLFFGLV
eukprot:m.111 g.111  ORF g.111 m.111 type:complete len:51 (+) comp32_c1_seq1:133-285(+)